MAGIAGNAVTVYQQALTTVSNNIANVATDGYSRQDVALQALPVTQTGQIFLGSGVAVDRIQRQYNEFVDSNLRNSNSDLASQEPMVNYANRVVDVMGGQTMGLNTALDQFFASARVMSSDPSSSVLRSSFVRDAQGVAERFGQLSAQLSLVEEETQQSLDSAVTQINALTKQIAQVNGQLTKKQSEADQPPDLLDQRDLLLRKLSTFAHVNTRFTANGTVSVSLGASMSQDVVVSGNSSLDIAASYDSKNSNKVSLTLDPYGKSTSLNSITSGTVAGLLSFREQVLGTAQGTLDNLAKTFAKEVNTVHQQGIDGYGNPGLELFRFDPTAANAASGISVAIEDPMRVSAAAQFRVIEGANNTSGTNASIKFDETPPIGPAPLQSVLVNNDHPSAARLVRVDTSLPVAAVASIPNGMSDVSVYLDSLESGQQLQIMTRDGRQIIGQSMASDTTLIGQMITTDNGFAAGASYSATYLNVSGASGYKDMNVFYGAQAQVQQQPIYNSKDQISGTKAFPALLEGARMQGSTTGLAATSLTLNGTALGALAAPAAGTTLQASAVANWINTLTNPLASPPTNSYVTATASNAIVLTDSQVKYGMPLWINGVSVDSTSATSLNGLANAINSASTSNVSARIDSQGQLRISNTTGDDITIAGTNVAGSSVQNALGLTAGTFRGQVSLTQALTDSSGVAITRPIQLGFGSSGTPADLAKLGFRTGAFISGAAKEDLLVFVTGAGTATVSASYAGKPIDAKQSLRAQPMKVEFTSATAYKITDTNTNTIVAERTLDPTQLNPGIRYQGIALSFTSPPALGDVFTLDGNKDGVGNNDNMLALAALEKKPLVGIKTLANAYIDQVNELGNIARQATIAKSALTVVHDQAVKSRDELSGVSLDKEAADLIRYQQAYQAAAKVLQVASQLFDSVLQVR
ncbi:MAG: flagellar hook-associated protein FlgK [Cryomorphaceae bacterium]|nr:flagellar hook-associated protein FlgK [Cryomorphaceae bacterium]